MGRAAQKPTRTPVWDECVFRIAKPSMFYGFGVQHDRRVDEPFEEQVTLQFVAAPLYPDRLKAETRRPPSTLNRSSSRRGEIGFPRLGPSTSATLWRRRRGSRS